MPCTAPLQVQGSATLLYDAVSMSAVSLSLQKTGGAVVTGSATGSLAGYSGTAGFTMTVPATKGVKPSLGLKVALPKVRCMFS